jgi:cell division protein FtsX
VDYKSIVKMTAAQLREQLAKYPDVTGVTAMKKDKLVDLLCAKLGVEKHAHGEVAVDKASIKKQIRELKKERDAAMAAKDHKKLATIHHAIHRQKHELRRAVKQAVIAAEHAKG